MTTTAPARRLARLDVVRILLVDDGADARVLVASMTIAATNPSVATPAITSRVAMRPLTPLGRRNPRHTESTV